MPILEVQVSSSSFNNTTSNFIATWMRQKSVESQWWNIHMEKTLTPGVNNASVLMCLIIFTEWEDLLFEVPTSEWQSFWKGSSSYSWFFTSSFRLLPGKGQDCTWIFEFRGKTSSFDREARILLRSTNLLTQIFSYSSFHLLRALSYVIVALSSNICVPWGVVRRIFLVVLPIDGR